MSQTRIGVLGGAFDPPHLTHVALARAACQQLGLDRLHVTPTGDAWHKTRTLTAAEHRLAMCRLAFEGVAQAVIDDREIRRAGPSYTVDTLRELRAEQPDAQLFLIMGADQARALTTWREWEAIVQSAIICVAERADIAQPSASYDAGFPENLEVRRIHLPASSLSATQVRSEIAAQQTAENMVLGSVARYIADHHLYQSAR